MKTITFNTGRRYTQEGQVIVATLHDDNVVTFFDHSRKIDGEFECLFPEDFDSKMVLDMYDSHVYKGSGRSWTDGMTTGGCNTRK